MLAKVIITECVLKKTLVLFREALIEGLPGLHPSSVPNQMGALISQTNPLPNT